MWGRAVAALVLAGTLAWATRPDGTALGGGDAPVRARGADGTVYLAERGERVIWKIDPHGRITLHASLPESAGPIEGIRAMTLDPRSGAVEVEDAFGLWRVDPDGEVTAAEEPGAQAPEPASGSPGDPAEAELTPRQMRLERFRILQLEQRHAKKRQRLARERDARARAEAQDARVEGLDPGPCLPRRPRTSPGTRMGGLCCLALLLGAGTSPEVLGALAQEFPGGPGPGGNLTGLVDRYSAQTTAGLGGLGPVCASAVLSAPPIAPCDSAYQTGLRAQVEDMRAQFKALVVAPASLPAPVCVRGESPEAARARIALGQGDILAAYDGLAADAWALQFQLERDGYAIQAGGEAVLLGQTAAKAAGAASTAAGSAIVFATGQVGYSLIASAYGVQAAGDLPAALANLALSTKAQYQRWALRQGPAILRDCTGAAAASALAAPAVPLPAPVSPLPALGDALLKLTGACAYVQQRQLDLPVCRPDSLMDFHGRNGTVAELYEAVDCLVRRRTDCPDAPRADAGLRAYTDATCAQFQNEIHGMGFLLQAAGNALFAASEAPVLAGNTAQQAGDNAQANGLFAQGHGLMVIGRGIYAAGYELQRIGALSRRWVADLALAFNAETRAGLDAAWVAAASAGAAVPAGSTGGSSSGAAASSTGAPLASTGAAAGAGPWPQPDAAASGTGASGAGTGAASTGPADTGVQGRDPQPDEPSASAASRTRALPLQGLLRALLPACAPGEL